MNTQADLGLDQAAPTPGIDATPNPALSPHTPADPHSSINNPQSNFPPTPLQIQDHIHPTDLLPPDARPFNRNGQKSRRANSAEKFLAELPPGACFRTLRLADVRSRPVDWLWPGRIPCGKVTLLVGDPGAGKSLVALDLAARLSRGIALPACQPPASPGVCLGEQNDVNHPRQSRGLPAEHAPSSVLLLSAEDNLADTIRPRLEAFGADLTRIITVTTADAVNSPLALPHCELLVPLVDRALDAAPDCRLIIVDPISAYLGRAVENINSEVRRIMSALNDLASRRQLAILAITHLRKKEGSALQRATGSLAFVAAARATWLITKDPADPKRRLMLPLKNNFAKDTTGLAFKIDASEDRISPTIEWSTEPVDTAADEALLPFRRRNGRPDVERADAVRWLNDQLADGVRASTDIAAFAKANGFKDDTVRRAFRDLGGEAVRVGFGPMGEWFWRLPGVGDQNPQATFADLWTDPGKDTARTKGGV